MKALISDPWVVNAASALVVALLVGVAAALGFRQRAKLSRDALDELASSEGQAVQAALIAGDGSVGVARLSSGALLIARAMADGVSARVVSADAARVHVASGKVTIVFADIGFPPIHLATEEPPPAWIAALAQGG